MSDIYKFNNFMVLFMQPIAISPNYVTFFNETIYIVNEIIRSPYRACLIKFLMRRNSIDHCKRRRTSKKLYMHAS